MDHTKELILKAHDGDKQARDQLVMENMGLVYSVARRFAGRGYDIEDISQIGTIGLIKAIDKFDLSQDVRISTYAVPMISGEIKRFLRDDGMVKISRSIKENGWKIKQAEQRLGTELGREATLDEIADATGLEKEDLVMALDAGHEVESIYQTVYQGDGNSIYMVDKLVAATESQAGEKLIDKMMIERLMSDLQENERLLIEMRYFKDKTQTQVARELGISQVQVSRMEKKILLRMRDKVI